MRMTICSLFSVCLSLFPTSCISFNHSSRISEYEINWGTSALLLLNNPTRLWAILFKEPYLWVYQSLSYKHCVNELLESACKGKI